MPPKEKEPRARRTVKACVICHKKKVRCDIDEVDGKICTPCARDGYTCIPRERKRKRFTLSPSPPIERPFKQQSAEPPLSEDNENTFAIAQTNPTSSAETIISCQHSNREALSTSEPGLGRRLSSTASLQEYQQHPTPHNSNPSVGNDSVYQPSPNIVSYLGRLEYLRNDVPVNDDAGLPNKVPRRLSDTDLEILRTQRVDELPPRPVRDSLMDAFWSRCYPWTPVVERGWIDDRRPHQVSLLLQHAMLLAGSRVSVSLPDYPPEQFYKKARVLFWMSAESDPIITTAATLLLHWWNPEGPERVSLDSSGFWLRVCTGLAYQVGLHREPNGRADAGLRRRIWWSLVVRDCLINAGHGRPRAIDLKLADVFEIAVLDFDGALAPANLFAAYIGISCILGDLTQSYLRRHGLQEQKRSLEDRLFRWLKTLPEDLQLCRSVEGRPLKAYNFEARQLHVQYFIVLVILNRPTEPKTAPSIPSLLASSFVAGIFEDFMARDELRYLGPIFTFYCLTAGMAQLSCFRYAGLVNIAEENLAIMGRALDDLSKRWPSGVGSLKHLMDVREKVMQRPSLGHFPDVNLSPSAFQFFTDFGPDLCRMWHPIHQRAPQTANIAPRELETAGILQGLRAPATHSIDMDVVASAAIQQQMMNSQMGAGGASIEPTLLQPQEWFGPYGGIGNWLMVDWDSFGW
ncbi:hypothetical protein K458DRAFT_320061 [Lentithecium fluviatile CBS 122367]|uniref:Zn(2)-C6 fungal-type domain-containing protein n=1 Tax=Lentithecium fluviatile CBS 122367 TaxID=1168545 RepID=A0A6G1IG51_9PLEO|nr:hypothetical protein K458DRAFT_320061 [Lentithecium fluviatile CBS 122367]